MKRVMNGLNFVKMNVKNTISHLNQSKLMKNVLKMSVEHGIEWYAAMERYLPCSVAVCGLCMVGDRLTCRDGPVMEGDWLLQQDDFATHHSH